MRTTGMTIVLAVAFMATAVLLIGCTSTEPPAAAPSRTIETGKVVAQTTCPVMGGPIDKSILVEHEGRKVHFCCQMCVATFQKDPGKYLDKLDAQK